MIEDRELDAWREQWTSVAKPSANFQRDFQRKVQQRIQRHNRRFVLGNIFTAIAFLGILIFAFYMRHQVELDGDRLVNQRRRPRFRSGFTSHLGFAANLAS